MALVDIISMFPPSHPGHNIFLSYIRTLFPRIVSAADPSSGVWWLVMTQPGRAGNYFESSGSAMFVYSLLKAVRLGYLDDSDGKIVAAAKKAYGYMVNNWVVDHGDGTMDWKNTVQVGSLNTDGSYAVGSHLSVARGMLLTPAAVFIVLRRSIYRPERP